MKRLLRTGRRTMAARSGAWMLLPALFVLLIACAPAHACTTIIVGKDASPNGEVLIGHNEDDSQLCSWVKAFPAATHAPGSYYSSYYNVHVPYPANTLAYVATKFYTKNSSAIKGDITGTLNSNQVAIFDNLAESWTDDPDLNDDGPASGLIWSEFNELAAMQATSARNAVQIIGALVEQYGLGYDTGTLYGVADENEGWWIEISGHQWCAQRVPDNAVQMRANAYGIGNVNLSDPDNFLYSPDMVTFAQANDLPGCDDTPFNWQTSYMYPGLLDWGFNSQRLEMIPPKLAAYQTSQGYVSKQNLMSVLRWHYEGTPQFPTGSSDPNYCNDPDGGVPYTVCNQYTVESSVVELRSTLPDCIGGVMWTALCMPDQSVYVPWYAGITTTPTEYTTGGKSSSPSTSAYWRCNSLASWVHSNYTSRITGVQNAWSTFEASAFAGQAAAEATALADYNADPATAIAYLTSYSSSLGHQAFVLGNGRPPMSITTNPQSQSVGAGSSVTFTVAASGGTTPYHYQWYRNGSVVSGATSASYTFTAQSSDNGATYYATVTDSASTAATQTSTTATLTVSGSSPLSITANPQSQTVSAGASVTFTVAASGGAPPYTYQWYRNGSAVSGATSASYTFTAQSSDNGATYYATVTDIAAPPATVTSTTATLTVTSGGTELLNNGGFESGSTGWTDPNGCIAAWAPDEPAYEGTKCAWMGGYGSTHTDTLYHSSVTIPSGATSATLKVYLHIDTADTSGTSHDTFNVQLRNGSGTLLTTLATYSNLNAASGYSLQTFNVSSYKGQTVRVYFKSTENNSLQTSFVADNVSLLWQ